MLKVGITGGIGSGKSIVCRVFKSLLVPVYNADQQAKILVETDPEIKSQITREFGNLAYVDGKYNREYIAGIVFKNKSLLDKLSGIVHPAVAADFNRWMQNYTEFSYVVEEAAILFEAGAHRKMDYMIVVDAPQEVRISRIMKRDSLNKEEIVARMHNQWPAGKIRALADWVIDNSDNVLVLPQIFKIHYSLINKSTL